MNIYQKLLAITSEIKNVSKNLEVGVGKSAYKAVGEADVLSAVKCLEEKHGVYSYPYARRIVESDILETEKEYNGTKTKSNQMFLRIETVYRFVNIENPDEVVDITTYGDGIDTQDKAPGKAMTYADKYALLKAYKIITGDDPDQHHSPDTASYENKKFMANPVPKTEPKPATQPKATKQGTPREQLIAKLAEKGIDATAYAKEKGLNSKTTPERFLELLKELEG